MAVGLGGEELILLVVAGQGVAMELGCKGLIH